MAIEDDLKKISELQADFKKTYGVFFEMDWAEQKIAIPTAGDVLSLTAIKRFDPTKSGLTASNAAFPESAKAITEIAFTPTAKDWRFCIGRGIMRGKKGELLSESWYCQASQMSADGKILTQKYIYGGDESLHRSDGLLE